MRPCAGVARAFALECSNFSQIRNGPTSRLSFSAFTSPRTRVPYEPARFCSACAGAIPTPGLGLVARTGEACAAANDLLLRWLQPDLVDQAPDSGRAGH